MANNATDIHWINNVAYGWTRPPYNIQPASQVLLSRNVQFGPPSTKVPASVLADPNQLRTADPLFASPPFVSPTGGPTVAERSAPLANRRGLHPEDRKHADQRRYRSANGTGCHERASGRNGAVRYA